MKKLSDAVINRLLLIIVIISFVVMGTLGLAVWIHHQCKTIQGFSLLQKNYQCKLVNDMEAKHGKRIKT